MDLEEQRLLAWIEWLLTKEAPRSGSLVNVFLASCGLHSAQLGPAVRERLVELAVRDGLPGEPLPRAFLTVNLYGSGATSLEPVAWERVVAMLGQESGPELAGALMLARAAVVPGSLESTFQRILDELRDRSLDPVPFALALARAVHLGGNEVRESALSLLARLANESPYAQDPRMEPLLEILPEP